MKHHVYKICCNDDCKPVWYSHNSRQNEKKLLFWSNIQKRCILLVFTKKLLSERFDLICWNLYDVLQYKGVFTLILKMVVIKLHFMRFFGNSWNNWHTTLGNLCVGSSISAVESLCTGLLRIFFGSPPVLSDWPFLVYDIHKWHNCTSVSLGLPPSVWRWQKVFSLIYLVCWRLSSPPGLLTLYRRAL